MKYVIDTHALIWFLEGNPRLGANAKAIISNPDSLIAFSLQPNKCDRQSLKVSTNPQFSNQELFQNLYGCALPL